MKYRWGVELPIPRWINRSSTARGSELRPTMEQFRRTLFIILQTPFLPQPHCFGGCPYCRIACLAIPSLRLLLSIFLLLRETANTDSITRSALSQDPPLQPPVLSPAGCPTLLTCTTDCCGPITFASTMATASGGDLVKRPHRSRRRTLENSYPVLLVNCSDQVGSPLYLFADDRGCLLAGLHRI
ncbi:hypothetical protein BDW60DRAFT_172566 [Aspergillus nidulans var. acristatus]